MKVSKAHLALWNAGGLPEELTIEQVDEPRAEKPSDTSMQLSLIDERGRQMKGWKKIGRSTSRARRRCSRGRPAYE
jgi:hypothetical protein